MRHEITGIWHGRVVKIAREMVKIRIGCDVARDTMFAFVWVDIADCTPTPRMGIDVTVERVGRYDE